MKFKILLYCLIISLFYYFWYESDVYFIKSITVIAEFWLQEITSSAQGYSSLNYYKNVYVILFLLFAPFILNKQKETSPFISRYTSRNQIYCKRIKDLVVYSFLYMFIHITINVVSILFHFEMVSQLRNDFLKASVVQAFYVFLFFLIVGLFYSILVDVMKKMFTAQLLTLFMVFILARLDRLNVWTPLNELGAYEIYFAHLFTLNKLLWGAGLYAIIISILLIVLHETLKKRDFIDG